MTVGIFGKLPAHGDFVTRGLTVVQRRMLDHWITHHIGQRDLPATGLRIQMSLDGTAMLAVVLPSHDKAGRRFPLVAFALGGGASQAEAEGWCDAAEVTATAAIEAGDKAEVLCAALPPLADGKQKMTDDCLWLKGGPTVPLTKGVASLLDQP